MSIPHSPRLSATVASRSSSVLYDSYSMLYDAVYLLRPVRGLTMVDPHVSSSASSASSRTAEPRGAVPRHRTTRGKAPRLHQQDQGAPKADSLAAIARELAIQSRREQGLPDHVADPHALAQGAQLVLDARRRRSTPRTARPP